MRKKSNSSFIAFAFLLIMAVIWLVPLLYGLLTSFKSEMELMTAGFRVLPIEWVLTNYTELL